MENDPLLRLPGVREWLQGFCIINSLIFSPLTAWVLQLLGSWHWHSWVLVVSTAGYGVSWVSKTEVLTAGSLIALTASPPQGAGHPQQDIPCSWELTNVGTLLLKDQL